MCVCIRKKCKFHAQPTERAVEKERERERKKVRPLEIARSGPVTPLITGHVLAGSRARVSLIFSRPRMKNLSRTIVNGLRPPFCSLRTPPRGSSIQRAKDREESHARELQHSRVIIWLVNFYCARRGLFLRAPLRRLRVRFCCCCCCCCGRRLFFLCSGSCHRPRMHKDLRPRVVAPFLFFCATRRLPARALMGRALALRDARICMRMTNSTRKGGGEPDGWRIKVGMTAERF